MKRHKKYTSAVKSAVRFSDYRYSLAKYGKDIRSKEICPACGQKTFVPYVDNGTGTILPSQYGKCDREDNCSYHLNPYTDGYGRKADNERYNPAYVKQYVRRPVEPAVPKEVSFIDINLVKKSLCNYRKNILVQFLCNCFTIEEISQAIKLYGIGTARNGETVFWQIDENIKVRTGKGMTYKPDGHRSHDIPPTWVHKVLNLPDFSLSQCLFGLHLIKDTGKPIHIVESEKTALICSIRMPGYTWLATGGVQNINLIDKAASLLRGRQVVLFPDLKCFDKWSEKATTLYRQYQLNISVSDYLERIATPEQREKGLDLADFILDNAAEEQSKPQQAATQPETPQIQAVPQNPIPYINEKEVSPEGLKMAQTDSATVLLYTYDMLYHPSDPRYVPLPVDNDCPPGMPFGYPRPMEACPF